MYKYIYKIFLLIPITILGLCLGCKEKKFTDTEWISGMPAHISFTSIGGEEQYALTYAPHISPEDINWTLSDNGEDWCAISFSKSFLKVTVTHSFIEEMRNTVLTVNLKQMYMMQVTISQDPGGSPEDKKIKITSAQADSEAQGTDSFGNKLYTVEKSFDGDYGTYFHSKEGVDISIPFHIEYTLESGHTLERFVYHPALDGPDQKMGRFNKFDIEVSTESSPNDFVKIASFERGENIQTILDYTFESPIENVEKVRLSVHSAYKNRTSCAEIEFYEISKNKFDYNKIFADKLYTRLKPEVTEIQLKSIPDQQLRELALALFNEEYDTKYRVAEYRPYQDPAVMAKANKTMKYSIRDNVTGIYAKKGDEVLIALDKLYEGAQIAVILQGLYDGYENSKTYELTEGLNRIKIPIDGLFYIKNLVQDPVPLILGNEKDQKMAADKTIKAHFIMGKVNGYYDSQKNKLSEWFDILNNAPYQDIDAIGKYAHITWSVADLKKYQTDIVQVLEKYDKLVWLEQEFMGLIKYNKMYNNRMHFCIDYKAVSPNASDTRTVYSPIYAEVFCNPSRFEQRLWGPAHEAGHINQTSGLKWKGMSEVSNNIFSCYIKQQFCGYSGLTDARNGYSSIYEFAIDLVVNGKLPHCQPDVQPIVWETKLVPFWQLKLYIVDALGQKDFYHDLFEHYRTTPSLDTGKYTTAIEQLDFVRQVCRISRLNLIDYFTKWGFFDAS